MKFKPIEGIENLYKNATDLSDLVEGEGKLPTAYFQAIFDYAEAWAERMEGAIANGETIEQCAERISHEVRGHSDLTGYMYGCAVSILATYWEHGEALRVWHNAKYNCTGEGTVNPAIITIGVKDE